MSNEERTCEHCKYFLADTHGESKIQFRCVNQESEKFGKEVQQPGGCDKRERFNPRLDMPFKDAMDRCFDELMKLKTAAGDFTEGNSKEQ